MSEKIILGVLTSLHKYNGIKNGKAKEYVKPKKV